MTAGSARDIACRELVELLTDYLEGALPPDEVAAIERHLDLCPGCAAYLDQLRAIIVALGGVPVQTMSDAANDELLELFHELLP